MDKILRWYIDGTISRPKMEVGGNYELDRDYEPVQVRLSVRIVGQGSTPLVIDINDDGESIATYKPALTQNQRDHTWTAILKNTLREGSKITLDIDQTFSDLACRDLTVELGLIEA